MVDQSEVSVSRKYLIIDELQQLLSVEGAGGGLFAFVGASGINFEISTHCSTDKTVRGYLGQKGPFNLPLARSKTFKEQLKELRESIYTRSK